MRSLAFTLALLTAACHTAPTRDRTPEVATQVAEPPVQARVSPPAGPPPRRASAQNFASPPSFGRSPPRQEGVAPAPVADPMLEERVERLRDRVHELEAQVAKLEGVARATRAPAEPARSYLASGWTVVVLFMSMIVCLSAAIVAIARAHRARLELSSLRAVGSSTGWPTGKRPTAQA